MSYVATELIFLNPEWGNFVVGDKHDCKSIRVGDGFVEVELRKELRFYPMHVVAYVCLEQETSPPVKPAEDAAEAEDWVGSAR